MATRMKGTDSAVRRRFVIASADARRDVTAPVDHSLGQALAAVSVELDPRHHLLVTQAGTVVDPAQLVGDVPDGALLTLVGHGVPAPSAARSGADNPTARPDRSLPWVLISTFALIVAAGGVAALTGGADSVSETAHAVTASLLALASLTTAAVWARAPQSARPPALLVGAPVALAFASAAVAVPTVYRGAHLAVAVGALSAAFVATVASALSDNARRRGTASALAIMCIVLAAIWGLTLMTGATASAAAALTMGLAVPGLRVVPALLLRLPEGYSIEYRHFIGNRWTVRGAIPDDPGPVTMPVIRDYVEGADARLATAVVGLVVAAVGSAPFVAPLLWNEGIFVRVGDAVLVATTVLGLLLWPRRTTRPTLRWTPRIGAALCVVIVAAAATSSLAGPTALAVATAVFACAVVTAAIIHPVSRRQSALGWSRLGDIIESASVVLALPAALFAAGTLEFMRAMVSG